MDALNKFVGIAVAVILIFIFPLMYNAQKQDMITQVYLSKETSEYVSTIKNKGFISYDMHKNYVDKLGNTGNVYKIEIIHSKKQVDPIYNDAGVFQNDISVSYINYYQDEVYAAFDKGEDYKLAQGDYVTVKIVNKSKTLATKVMQMVYGKLMPTEQILVSHGGLVRDETY